MAVRHDEAPPGPPPADRPVAPATPADAPAHPWDRALRWLDRRHQRITPVAFVGAIVKKAGEDQVSLLAAVMSHYGMLSVFPLLLLLVTVAGFLFRNDAEAQQAVIDAALANFPVLGEYLRASIRAVPASGFAAVFGLLLLAWASLGFTKTAQVAMAEIWGVPKRLRPGFWPHLGRSVWALVVLGLPTLLTATITIVAAKVSLSSAAASLPDWLASALRVAELAVGLTVVLSITFASQVLAFRALTPRSVPTRHLLPGTVAFTVFWTGLTIFGGALIANRLNRANQLYGTIGFVIGLIFWIYLGAYGALLASEANAVRAARLYPRTLVGPPRTSVDRRALRRRARTEELVPGQVVDVRFDGPDAPGAAASGGSEAPTSPGGSGPPSAGDGP